MANTYKDIIITPNRSSDTADPNISFRGANSASNTEITLKVYPDSNGTVSFEGSAGQLFSITNDLTGTIFSVNDVSGIPSLEIDANGFVEIAAYGGNVGIGEANTSNISNKLYVKGNVTVTDGITAASFITSAGLNVTNQANNAYTQANNAYGQANLAYTQANNEPIAKSAYGQANLAYTQSNNSANLVAIYANNSLRVANANLNFNNTATINVSIASGGTRIANVEFAVNTSGSGIITAQLTAQNAYGQANLAYTQANNAYGQANLAYTQANNAYDQANAAYLQANTGSIITNDITTNSTYYVIFTSATSGAASPNVANTKLTFNPNTGTLSATIFNSISDREAKENIRDLGYGLNTVLTMTGKKFELKESHETSIGFIAQDLEKIVPEVVLEHRDGYKGVNYGVIVAILVEAIKELNSKIENLKNDQ